MTTMTDLEPAARHVAALLPGVRESRLPDPTPCPGYTVGGLLAHLEGLTVAFRDAARKDLGPTTADPGDASPALSDDWRDRLPQQLKELAAAWRSPEAWEGETEAGGVTLTGEMAGKFALNELVLHGWDLARATGQPFECDEASARVSIELLSQWPDADRVGTGFGPAVPVPPGAPLIDQAVGLGGRRPTWTPDERA